MTLWNTHHHTVSNATQPQPHGAERRPTRTTPCLPSLPTSPLPWRRLIWILQRLSPLPLFFFFFSHVVTRLRFSAASSPFEETRVIATCFLSPAGQKIKVMPDLKDLLESRFFFHNLCSESPAASLPRLLLIVGLRRFEMFCRHCVSTACGHETC